jgi:hypothetical protein
MELLSTQENSIHGLLSHEGTGAQFEPLPMGAFSPRSEQPLLLASLVLTTCTKQRNATQSELSILNDCLFDTSIIFCISSLVGESEDDHITSLRRKESVRKVLHKALGPTLS